MKVEYDKSFEKSLDKVKIQSLYNRIEKVISEFEEVTSISQMRNISKLSGYKKYYRVRIGDYRLGIELVDKDTILFIIIGHRKDFYRYFP